MHWGIDQDAQGRPDGPDFDTHELDDGLGELEASLDAMRESDFPEQTAQQWDTGERGDPRPEDGFGDEPPVDVLDSLFDGAAGEPIPAGPDIEDTRALSVRELRKVILESVRSGLALPDDVYDDKGVLLLAAGSLITPRFLQLLRERGVTRVRLRPKAPARPRVVGPPEPPPLSRPTGGRRPAIHVGPVPQTQLSRDLDRQLAGELQRTITLAPVKAWRRPRLPVVELLDQAARGQQKHEATSLAVSGLCDAVQRGRPASSSELKRAVSRFMSAAATDFDLLPLIVAMQQSHDDYLFDHCVNVSLLSMAMACQLGITHENVALIGLGAMLQDIGMLRVPASIRLSTEPLGEREWQEIRRHPLHTLDMLAPMRGIPQAAKFIAYQVHERGDGGGYPFQRHHGQVHLFARLVAIADAYAAMTHPRPYRDAYTPYEAARTILYDAAAHRFAPQLVRAFLDTVSIFPIGSRVTLSNGSLARVLRANPDLHTKPVVEELTADGVPTGNLIDLAAEDAPVVILAG
ncbi:MAG: HD-GYP domain-containing protein [Phycisphaerales bacterium]|nr:MAG: HD-GYP domain-containing protein [Phycisphaerales bacterium]